MKKLNILKKVLDFLFILAILGSIGIIVMIIFKFNHIHLKWSLDSFQQLPKADYTAISSEGNSKPLYHKIINASSEIVRLLIYVYCVYLIRKVIIHFQKRDAFSNEVSQSFNWIGKLILILPFIDTLFDFIRGSIKILIAIINSPHSGSFSFNPEFDFDLFGDSFLITIGLGFFFMVLSEVFKMATELKEENELTI